MYKSCATLLATFASAVIALHIPDDARAALSRRPSIRDLSVGGMLYCGNMPAGDLARSQSILSSLGTTYASQEWPVAAGACNRVSCWDTTAVYVCNDNNYPIIVQGGQVQQVGDYVKNCCGGLVSDTVQHTSGQKFTPWGWNVAVGYGNCNDDARVRPHDAGGWGINGVCLVESQPY